MNTQAPRNPLVHALYLLVNVNLHGTVEEIRRDLNRAYLAVRPLVNPATAGQVAAAYFRLYNRLVARVGHTIVRDSALGYELAAITKTVVRLRDEALDLAETQAEQLDREEADAELLARLNASGQQVAPQTVHRDLGADLTPEQRAVIRATLALKA